MNARWQSWDLTEPAEPGELPESGILVVCSANVCRSPLAAAVIQRSLAEIPGGGRVAHAGLEAADGHAACALVLRRHAAELPVLRRHRSRALRGGESPVQLVLAMTVDQRARIVRSMPGTQHRIFTLAEAHALAADAVLHGLRPERQSMESVAALLHSRRGLFPAPAEEARRWRRRPAPPAEPLDIIDGHTLGERLHESTVLQVPKVADGFARAVRELLQ